MTLFASLQVRNYRLFASGQVVSLTGTWMQRVAQDWLVLKLSHTSGVAIGLATALQFAPTLLLSLYGGTVADRVSKRRLLMVTQTVMGLLALTLGMLVVTGGVQLWHVYALAAGLGVATSFDTPTRQAFVGELVGADLVTNAVSLNSATFNTARIIGPAVAGFLITFIGTGWVFLLNAATFVAVLAGLAAIREGELFAVGRAPRRRGQLREGVAYVRGRADLLLPIVLAGFVGTFGFNFQQTTALMAKGTFHRDAAAYGVLSTALAVGSLIGALLAARRPRPRYRLLLGSAFAFGVLELTSGLMPGYWSFLVMLVPTGVAALTFSTAANSSIQLGASPAMRGRAMALYVLVFLGGTPFGALFVGWLAEMWGPRWSLLSGGAISAAAAVVIGLVLRRVTNVRVRPRLRGGGPWLEIRPPQRSARPAYDDVRPA